ncbi:MAG: discoidin domain-containing protein, partial [Actinobacteria bacterium]|nr:discoidin domain-containing protein [Actinomycetota bacterium]
MRSRSFLILSLMLAVVLLLTSASFAPPARAADDWLVMVYLDGDNNLEGAGITDFLEMSSAAEVSPSVNVHILVQVDLYDGATSDPNYDGWTTTKRYKIENGTQPLAAQNISDLGELNMGDPQTLVDFVQWAQGRPEWAASRKMLVLWDHGSGWKRQRPETRGTKGVCWDDTNGGAYINSAEMRTALDTITSGGTDKIDVIGFDACLMGMAEVDYQVYPFCEVRASSEASEPNNGWPYDLIVGDLVASPTMTDNQLGTAIVDRYYQSYVNDEVLSAVDFSAGYDNLVSAVNSLGSYLRSNLQDEYFNIWGAAAGAQRFDDYDYIDLYDFASRLKSLTSDTTLKSKAQTVMNRVNDVVIQEKHGAGWPGAHGISIYFTFSSGFYLNAYNGSSGNLAFTADTCWDEFQQEFFQGSANNFAAAANGGQVVDFSEEWGGDWVADNLIDSGFSGWSSDTTIAGNYITVKLAGGTSREIGTIYVDPGPSNSPSWIDPPGTMVKDFHIDISNDNSSFQTVYSGSFALSEMNQLKAIDISSQKKSAKYVKIVTDSCHDPSWGWVDVAELQVYGNTPVGQNVAINPDTGVTVEFDQVTYPGQTSSSANPDPLVAGYQVAEGTCRDVTTTAGYQGNIRVTLSYSDAKYSSSQEDRLVALHKETGNWVDRTKTRDPSANTVTAEVTSLSEFVVALPGLGPTDTYYFAEGTCRPGFDPYICVQNPGGTAAEVTITYMKGDGTTDTENVTVPANSRSTVVVKNKLGEAADEAHDFSSKVECT